MHIYYLCYINLRNVRITKDWLNSLHFQSLHTHAVLHIISLHCLHITAGNRPEVTCSQAKKWRKLATNNNNKHLGLVEKYQGKQTRCSTVWLKLDQRRVRIKQLKDVKIIYPKWVFFQSMYYLTTRSHLKQVLRSSLYHISVKTENL